MTHDVRRSSNICLSLIESGRAALDSISSYGMRSFLTVLGIIIGVCSVIVVAALMDKLSDKVNGQLKDLGTDSVTLKAHTTTEQEMMGQLNKLNFQDYQLLKDRIENVSVMTARMRAFSLGKTVKYGTSQVQTQIVGTQSDYQFVVKIFPKIGRFLRDEDDRKNRRVVFVGSSLAKKLNFDSNNPVGEFLEIEGEWFRIIGIAEERGSLFGFDQDNYLFMPLSTVKSILGNEAVENIDIMYIPKAPEHEKRIEHDITTLLRQKHRLSSDDPNFFEFETASKTKEQFADITGAITSVAIAVVAISLIVGGVGIMNIMLVSVTERTKEIGIAKALGATPLFILFQFLFESVALAIFGAIVGLTFGLLIVGLVTWIVDGSFALGIPLWSIALSIGFTSFIGIVFGFAPALKASKLHPIDALRFE